MVCCGPVGLGPAPQEIPDAEFSSRWWRVRPVSDHPTQPTRREMVGIGRYYVKHLNRLKDDGKWKKRGGITTVR
jgi:hypothetical protein